MTDQERAARLAAIAQEVRACKLCRLYENTTHAVPGSGSPDAEIVFVGEGPGYHEDQKGLPFVGRSGEYLDQLLAMIGLKRDQVFIANVVKHRPPDNRDPLPDEIVACKPFLDRQIEVINPLVIATLGRHSMARYFPDGRISQIHGRVRYDDGRAYYPLYHPAAVLRNPGLRGEMEADFKRLLDVLAEVKTRRAKGDDHPKEEPPEKPQQLTLF